MYMVVYGGEKRLKGKKGHFELCPAHFGVLRKFILKKFYFYTILYIYMVMLPVGLPTPKGSKLVNSPFREKG